MLNSTIAIKKTTALVECVDLITRRNNWRDFDVTNPELTYKVKVRLVIDGQSDPVFATVRIPANVVDGQLEMLGIESDTDMIPKLVGSSAAVVLKDGCVAIDSNGLPIIADTEKEGTSHWAVARFVPTRSNAALELENIEVTPWVIPSGSMKGALAMSGGLQSCGIDKYTKATPVLIAPKGSGLFRSPHASKGMKVSSFESD